MQAKRKRKAPAFASGGARWWQRLDPSLTSSNRARHYICCNLLAIYFRHSKLQLGLFTLAWTPGVFMVRERKARKPVTREISNSSAGATVVGLILAAMLQWAAVLAVCPIVHELIHHDAHDEHHDC